MPPLDTERVQERIDLMAEFNGWIKQHASTTTPPMALLDTTHIGADSTAAAIRDWVLGHLGASIG